MTFAAAATNIGLWQFDRDTNKFWVTEHCRHAVRDREAMHRSRREAFWRLFTPMTWKPPGRSMQRSFGTEQPSSSDVRIVLPDREVRWIRMRARRIPKIMAGQSNWAGFSSTSPTKSWPRPRLPFSGRKLHI